MYYHGLEDAALRAGLSLGGRTTLRVIVRALARDETVRAIGRGHLNETAGYIVLTTRRLLVIEASGLGSRTLLDAPHGSIEALSLGKRITGETLRVVLPAGPIVISRLGHGEGHGIVKSYRARTGRSGPASSPPPWGTIWPRAPVIHDGRVTPKSMSPGDAQTSIRRAEAYRWKAKSRTACHGEILSDRFTARSVSLGRRLESAGVPDSPARH